MTIDWAGAGPKEVAAVVTKALGEGGVQALLVGGSCVSLYTDNRYLSHDLDFVTHSPLRTVAPLLEAIGFSRRGGRHFVREGCPFYVEFVAPPAAIGGEPVRERKVVRTKLGTIEMLTPTDCVKDRLAAFYHWKDPQSLEQALLVAFSRKVNLGEVRRWSALEGFGEECRHFEQVLRRLKSASPKASVALPAAPDSRSARRAPKGRRGGRES